MFHLIKKIYKSMKMKNYWKIIEMDISIFTFVVDISVGVTAIWLFLQQIIFLN